MLCTRNTNVTNAFPEEPSKRELSQELDQINGWRCHFLHPLWYICDEKCLWSLFTDQLWNRIATASCQIKGFLLLSTGFWSPELSHRHQHFRGTSSKEEVKKKTHTPCSPTATLTLVVTGGEATVQCPSLSTLSCPSTAFLHCCDRAAGGGERKSCQRRWSWTVNTTAAKPRIQSKEFIEGCQICHFSRLAKVRERRICPVSWCA